jgi:hypothetical protein
MRLGSVNDQQCNATPGNELVIGVRNAFQRPKFEAGGSGQCQQHDQTDADDPSRKHHELAVHSPIKKALARSRLNVQRHRAARVSGVVDIGDAHQFDNIATNNIETMVSSHDALKYSLP